MRGEYNTRQKREMLAFLKQHDLEHYSVDELVFEMEEQGEKIGRTTVYRFLEQMAEQGTVRKYQSAQGVTQYQHIADSSACDAHFHMMFKSCGKLYHVNCDLMDSLALHIRTEHNFQLDPRETILVGICARCASQQEGERERGTDYASGCDHRL